MSRKKKGDHVIMRNGKMFCSHCGQYQAIPLPCSITVFGAMCKAYAEEHAACEKTWTQPECDLSLPYHDRVLWWMMEEARGTSSQTIFSVMIFSVKLEGTPSRDFFATRALMLSDALIGPLKYSHPHDPDDLYRCYRLLKAIPEWNEHLQLMKPVSPAWSALVDHWDELMKLLNEQILTEKDNGLYDLMKKLTQPQPQDYAANNQG